MTLRPKLVSAALAAILTLGIGGAAVAGMTDLPGRLDPADANDDGQITRAEWVQAANARFNRLDADKDGKLTAAEMPRRHGHRGHHGPHRGGPHWGPGGPDLDQDGPPPGAPATPAPQE